MDRLAKADTNRRATTSSCRGTDSPQKYTGGKFGLNEGYVVNATVLTVSVLCMPDTGPGTLPITKPMESESKVNIFIN
ncbi:hypothetical protein GCM10027423_17530 [Spirosoma arcticum]